MPVSHQNRGLLHNLREERLVSRARPPGVIRGRRRVLRVDVREVVLYRVVTQRLDDIVLVVCMQYLYSTIGFIQRS